MSSKARKNKAPLRAASTGVGCSLAIFATQALAQSGGGLEEIVVTAQKREENLQEVPISVSAITGQSIQTLHVHDLKDLTGTIPNVQIQVNAGLTNAISYVIRGIGIVANPSPYVGTEVGTVVDGVVQTVNELGLVDRFDVERVEILRGPQGTLFGANTTGGVVNIVTRQPTGELDAYGQVGLGNYNSKNLSFALNFPVTDTLAGKVVVAHRSRDGYYTNRYNGEDIGHLDSTGMRGYLRWQPNDDLDVTLKLEGQKIRNGTDVLLNISYPGEIFYRDDTPYDFKLYSDVPDQHDSDSHGGTLTAVWDSPIGEVTSISSYYDWKTRGYQDIDGIDTYGYAQIGNTTGWQGAQEIRLAFEPTESTQMQLGVFYQKWHYDSDGLGWLAFVDPTLQDQTLAEQDSENISLFGQFYWDITDRLRLQAGVRGTREEVEMWRADFFSSRPGGTDPKLGYGNLDGAILLPVDPANPPVSGKETWDNWGGKIGLDYKFTDTTMAYGYYARGFKSGGFNGRISRAEDLGPFDPEYVDSFEVGLKTDLFDQTVRLNFAAFVNKWTDMQVNEVFFDGDPPTAHSAIVNAGEATTQGFELEAQFAITDAFTLSASAGFLDATYDKFRVGSGPQCPPQPEPQPVPCSNNYDGRDLPYSPEFTGSVTANYAFPLFGGESRLTVQVNHNGERWGNFTQAASELMDDVTLLNASIEWSPAGGEWTVALWGRNLTNELYTSLALDAPPLFTEGLLGNPREYGFDIRYGF
jgi:iron complex outermembrane receptor protein